MEKAVTDTTTIAIIVLDKYQPAPPNYTLTITTNQQSAGVKAGTSGAVHDVIHASKEDFSTTLTCVCSARNDSERDMLRSK